MRRKSERSPSAQTPQREYAVTPEPLIIELQERPLQPWPEPRPARRNKKARAEWAEQAGRSIASQIRDRERRLESDAADVALWEGFVLPSLRGHRELIPWLPILRTFLPGFARWYLNHGPMWYFGLEARALDELRSVGGDELHSAKARCEALDDLHGAGVDVGRFLGVLWHTSHGIEVGWVKWITAEARARGMLPPGRPSKGEERPRRAAPKRAWESIRKNVHKLAAMPISREAHRRLELEAKSPEAVKELLRVFSGYANAAQNPTLNTAIVEAFRFLEPSGLSANKRFVIIGAFVGLAPDAVRQRYARHVSSRTGRS